MAPRPRTRSEPEPAEQLPAGFEVADTGLIVPGPLVLPSVPTRPVDGAPIATAWGQAIHDAVFGSGVGIDVREGFYVVDLPAGVALGIMPRWGLSSGFTYHQPLGGLAGRILGMYYRLTTAPTAGTITLGYRTGGTDGPETIVVGVGGAQNTVVMLTTPLTFASATNLSVTYATAAGLTPANTIDVAAGLIVAYNYAAV